MQAIILAAGHGTRLKPLTDKVPKPLVKILGKPLIEYVLDVLIPHVSELVIVTGYKSEVVRNHIGKTYHGVPVIYVEQPRREGTGHAMMLCKEYIKDDFILMYADEMVDRSAISKLAKEESAALAIERDDPENFGVIIHDSEMNILDLEEKPENPKSNLVSAAAFKLTPEIFKYYPPPAKNGEYYLADMIPSYLKEQPMKVVVAEQCLTVNKPGDIAAAEAALKKSASA